VGFSRFAPCAGAPLRGSCRRTWLRPRHPSPPKQNPHTWGLGFGGGRSLGRTRLYWNSLLNREFTGKIPDFRARFLHAFPEKVGKLRLIGRVSVWLIQMEQGIYILEQGTEVTDQGTQGQDGPYSYVRFRG